MVVKPTTTSPTHSKSGSLHGEGSDTDKKAAAAKDKKGCHFC